MKWVTRARPKIDRIACPWLIARFIRRTGMCECRQRQDAGSDDADAEFLYVPADEVLRTASETGATPYDVPNVELGHVGGLCSFDAFIKKYRLTDPALQRLAVIVRGADTGRPELTPESPGLLAISLGLSQNIADDHAMLRQGMVIYDALYAWCQSRTPSSHGGSV